MDINSQHQNLLGNQISPKSEEFVFWWPFWIQNGHHGKPMMTINSQHHNLLGNQISSKSEDFCIWQPFCTLVTMSTAAILNFFKPQKAATHYGGYSYKVSWSLMKGIQNVFKSPPFLFPWQLQQSLSNRFRFFLAYLVPLDVDVVPIKFHKFLFGE